MHQLQKFIFLVSIFYCAACSDKKSATIQRPIDPWAFRSVLDMKPRMLTLALDTECYVAYDLANCKLYKAWKGGVLMEGAPYTNKKNVQPESWGTAYVSDTTQQSGWVVELNGKKDSSYIISKGYLFRKNEIYLKYNLILSSRDTIHVEERPEFFRNESGTPGLARSFILSGVPEGVRVFLNWAKTKFPLVSNSSSRIANYFETLPAQHPPQLEEGYDHRGKYFMEKSDCFTCHEIDKKTVGPSLHQIAQRYHVTKNIKDSLVAKVQSGGTGVWGTAAMNAHPRLTAGEIGTMLDYIFTLKVSEEKEADPEPKKAEVKIQKRVKPGFDAPLEGLHPSYDLTTIHKNDFRPRVGGLAFLPDGRLLVTTWDVVGGVYLVSGVATGDTNKITVKRIASGLAEPLGITTVGKDIYVLQKHELTQLIDLDDDEIIDEYRTICNSYGVSSDFHEFAYGLVYKDGYFYVSLGMAMRLMSNEKQKPDRGRTIKIASDGSYEWVNYGLRQPNGIGIGVDNELFECENQGEWIPGNKLIHIRKGDYNGMPWGLADPSSQPPITPPAIWLPEDEIANSPSQPVLMQDGPYKGQMLHGDVTYGGIQRDFLEKINGAYQGAVFQFTQGLEAGVNRLLWGPDGALYVGGIGMVGGWSWKEHQFGLQRLKYNGKSTFEMLAVRAKPHGFEIEFTEPLMKGKELNSNDILIKQWWYLPTPAYGGPKKDLETMKITKLVLSEDRKKIYLEIPKLKKEHVVYVRLPEDLKSSSGQLLWSGQAWYTLNSIPE